MFLDLNGNRMQTGNTSTMIFNIDTIVSYVSKFMSLQAGDIITTGTPPGVGMGKKPPLYLKKGDEMYLSIDHLGSQHQRVKWNFWLKIQYQSASGKVNYSLEKELCGFLS